MRSLVRALLPTCIFMVVGQLAVGMTLKGTRTGPDGKQVEFNLSPVHVPRWDTTQIHPSLHNRRQSPMQVDYSYNWCGARLRNPDPANPLVSATTQFTVPRLGVHPLEPIPQSAGAWVGIGGDSCRTGLVQVGVDAIINTIDGNTTQHSWMFIKIYPGFYYEMDESISPDDTFQVDLAFEDLEFLHVSTKDLSTNGTDNFGTVLNIGIPLPAGAICPGDVEWIVSNPKNETDPLAGFAGVKFFKSSATRKDGTNLTIDDATMTWVADDSGDLKCIAQRGDEPGEVGITRQG